METDQAKMADDEVVKLAQAEHDAGVPDIQTAAAAAEAKKRQQETAAEIEAYPT